MPLVRNVLQTYQKCCPKKQMAPRYLSDIFLHSLDTSTGMQYIFLVSQNFCFSSNLISHTLLLFLFYSILKTTSNLVSKEYENSSCMRMVHFQPPVSSVCLILKAVWLHKGLLSIHVAVILQQSAHQFSFFFSPISYPSSLSTQILTWFVFFSGSSVLLSTSTLPWFSSQPIFLPVCSLKSVHLSLHFSTLFVRYTCPNTVHFFLLSSTAFHSPLLHSSELYGVVPSLLSPVNPLSYLISVISQPNNAK